jgi:UDP-N-acetylmuramoyl-tripeptide--D-alanyl-D-alanine ligase
VPLSLARMPKATRFGVFEIGMNHAGEITPLTAMVLPDVAVITTVAAVHLEHFPDVEAIADAKAEIFSGLAPGGLAVVNRDIPYYERLVAAACRSPAGHVASFGAHAQADARLIDFKPGSDHAMIEADICGQRLSYRLGAPGRHLAMNSLAVLLVAKSLGLDVDVAAVALAFFEAQAGRGQQIVLPTSEGPVTLIDESYNANPVSMRAALALVGDLPVGDKGRRIAVLGDMLELGEQGASLHAELAEAIEAHRIDLVFAAGPLMKNLYETLPAQQRGSWREAAIDLGEDVAEAVHAGDVVVVKGSNGSRMSRVVDAMRARHALAMPEGIH